MRRISPSDLCVFVLLVAIAVVGRAERFDWNFTPVVASTLFAGFYFRRAWVATLVPLVALPLSDLVEPAHNNLWVMITVWASMLLPAVLGPWLRSRPRVATAGIAALAPATLFFVTTNFAVWATNASAVWPKTMAGLLECYTVAIPFYGKMIAGDLFYLGLIFGAYGVAMHFASKHAAKEVLVA